MRKRFHEWEPGESYWSSVMQGHEGPHQAQHECPHGGPHQGPRYMDTGQHYLEEAEQLYKVWDMGIVIQQRQLYRPPDQKQPSRPPQQMQLSRPPHQRQLPRPPQQRQLSRPPQQRQLPRPPQQRQLHRTPQYRDTGQPYLKRAMVESPGLSDTTEVVGEAWFMKVEAPELRQIYESTSEVQDVLLPPLCCS